jgi:hypothetical protein
MAARVESERVRIEDKKRRAELAEAGIVEKKDSKDGDSKEGDSKEKDEDEGPPWLADAHALRQRLSDAASLAPQLEAATRTAHHRAKQLLEMRQKALQEKVLRDSLNTRLMQANAKLMELASMENRLNDMRLAEGKADVRVHELTNELQREFQLREQKEKKYLRYKMEYERLKKDNKILRFMQNTTKDPNTGGVSMEQMRAIEESAAALRRVLHASSTLQIPDYSAQLPPLLFNTARSPVKVKEADEKHKAPEPDPVDMAGIARSVTKLSARALEFRAAPVLVNLSPPPSEENDKDVSDPKTAIAGAATKALPLASRPPRAQWMSQLSEGAKLTNSLSDLQSLLQIQSLSTAPPSDSWGRHLASGPAACATAPVGRLSVPVIPGAWRGTEGHSTLKRQLLLDDADLDRLRTFLVP